MDAPDKVWFSNSRQAHTVAAWGENPPDGCVEYTRSDLMPQWQQIETLPPPGKRPGRVFVIVQGYQFHSDVMWIRKRAGIARTQNDGFYPDDIAEIERQDHMDIGSGVVTHWMPWCLPHLPNPTT